MPPSRQMGYLDSVGMAASLGNKLVVGRSLPTARQIALWDRLMVPCSRLLDPCLGLGESVLGIQRKAAQRPNSER